MKTASKAVLGTAVVAFAAYAADRILLPLGVTPIADVYEYASYLFVKSGDCDGDPENMPTGWDCEGAWKYTDYRETATLSETYDPLVSENPQELYGVKGSATNRAFEVSTGRPDVLIAVYDSGIRWHNTAAFAVANKTFINPGELPMPASGPNPDDTRFGGYDANGDGLFNVLDYADDNVPDFNENGHLDAQDLIHFYSDSVDDDNNGYTDDISGWDFYEDDNDPADEAEYGHGTGEAKDSAADISRDINTQCPNCMVMHMRVGDSFVADVNHFAEGVIYGVDMGVNVVQSALGTLNHTSYGQYALDYAYERGVIANTSEADESAGHHNWPSAYDHTMVFNSVREVELPTVRPHSYLMFNGCTNFGSYTYISVPSTSCSSEATGRSSGISGLLQSAVRNAVEQGRMSNYIRDDGSEAAYGLSSLEAMQLWRLAGDDIDFSSTCTGDPATDHAFCNKAPDGVVNPIAPVNNFNMVGYPLPTDRYTLVKGWDYFSGYGRANNGRLLRFIGREGFDNYVDKVEGPAGLTAQDRIPPEADITSPRWWGQYALKADGTLVRPDDQEAPDMVVIEGYAAANRVTSSGGTFSYILEYAPHVQGLDYLQSQNTAGAAGSEERSNGPWTQISSAAGLTTPVRGELGRIEAQTLRDALDAAQNPFTPLSDPTSEYHPEQHAIRIRLRVIASPSNTADNYNNEAVFQKQIDVYPAEEVVLKDDLGLGGKPTGGAGSLSWHDIDGDGHDELLVPTSDGLIHAYTDVTGNQELPGWPVQSLPETNYRHMTTGSNAYSQGHVPALSTSPFLLGSPTVADIDDDGQIEVLHGDLGGRVYAWEPDGSMKEGWPVSVNFNFSRQPECTGANIPACDDFAATPVKDEFNNRDWGVNSPPVVGDIDPATPGLEVVFGANDSHAYAFHADGTPVNGWPVLLRDPTKVATVDPSSHFVTYVEGAGQHYGAKVLAAPALGDIDNDGQLDVVIAVNEQYSEEPNLALDAIVQINGLLEQAGQGLIDPGNTRLYALYGDGAAHAENDTQANTPHPHDQAYMPGWPVHQALLLTELLPYVGAGSNGQPVLADVDTDGDLEIFSASAAGPAYVWNHDGSSFYGTDANGKSITLATTGPNATDSPVYVGVGGFAAGSMDGGGHISFVAAGAGLIRLLDLALGGRQIGAKDYLQIWDSRSGQYEPNAPIVVNDLQFMNQPSIFDIDGDGNAEAAQGTAVSDTVLAGLQDISQTATRHHQGGWQIATVGIGAGAVPDSDVLHYGSLNREGWLRLYPTTMTEGSAEACTARAEWPEYGHDAMRTGNYHTDGERPYPVTNLVATVDDAGAVTLGFTAPGDDRNCGSVSEYHMRIAPEDSIDWLSASSMDPITASAAPGEEESLTLTDLSPGTHTVLVRAYDEAGNGSALRSVSIIIPGTPTPTPSPTPTATPTSEPTPTPTPTASPTNEPSPTPTPSGTGPTPTPSGTSPTPTATPPATPTPSPSVTPTETPRRRNGSGSLGMLSLGSLILLLSCRRRKLRVR